MKKVLLSLVALAAMVACNNEETVVVDSHSLITFDNSFVEVKTRVEDPSITTASIDAFDVWGFIDKASGIVFSQEHVTKNAEKNEWEYVNKQYWLPDNHYYFFAVAPANAIAPLQNAPIVVDTTDMNIEGLGTIKFTNENGTLDLLYAEKDVDTAVINDPGKVSLQFMHLLSKVQFTFKNVFPNDNAKLKVTGLKIVDAPKNGSVAVNDVRTNYTWNIISDETTTLEFGDVNDGERFNNDKPKFSDCARLTIPAAATHRYHVVFNLELYYGDELAGESQKSVYLENQAFAIGKNYNIVAEIGPKNFADDPLNSIEFDVITVEEWGDPIDVNDKIDYDNQGGNNGGNQGGNQDPTQPVALATPTNVAAVVANGNVTVSWTAVEHATSYDVTFNGQTTNVTENTYSFAAPAATNVDVDYIVTVVAKPAEGANFTPSTAAEVEFTIAAATQPETPAAGSAITVAKFLELADTATEYELTGKITRVVNTTYGNFDLTDDTGTIYVYGLDVAWEFREGDTITIVGKYAYYEKNATHEVVDARYVSHVAAPYITASVASVLASATSATINVESNLAWTVSCSATWISSYTQSGNGNGTIVVTFPANDVEENREAVFTLTADGLSYEVTLVQNAKPTSGVVEGGSADWSSLTKSSSYITTEQTINGWKYINCAVMCGGSTDSNPMFKSMMGEDENVKGLTINGKTTAVGKITSPEITTGCGTLEFNYGYPFSESNGIDFKVEIIQNGSVVKTIQVKDSAATKLEAYEFKQDVNVAGTFQIVFTNNSPSKNTGNKDRYTIWNVEWTGCN